MPFHAAEQHRKVRLWLTSSATTSDRLSFFAAMNNLFNFRLNYKLG